MPRALALAAAHQASVHATLVHCVQSDRGRSALLVAGRFPQRDGSLPVWRSIRSPAFGRVHLPTALATGTPLRELAERARTTRESPPATVRIGRRVLTAAAHDNRHAMLVLLTA
jgi:hypothetical protein